MIGLPPSAAVPAAASFGCGEPGPTSRSTAGGRVPDSCCAASGTTRYGWIGLFVIALTLAMPALAQLRGHGGPVRAVAVSPDGKLALSGSFDQSTILWSLDQGTALAVLRF